MKKLLSIAAVAAVSTLVHGQGYIITQATGAAITTNTSPFTAQGTGTIVSGKLDKGANDFYFALLFDATTPSGNTPTSAGWAQVTQNGGAALAINNNTILNGGTTGTGTSVGAQVNLAAGQTYNVELVGWSASLGTTWAQVASQYTSGTWTAPGYFNFSSVSTITPFATSGAGAPALFPTVFPNSSLVLYAVSATPEPASMALIGLGGASLLLFRRKNK